MNFGKVSAVSCSCWGCGGRCVAVLELLCAQPLQVCSFVALELLEHCIQLLPAEWLVEGVAAGDTCDWPLAMLVSSCRLLFTHQVFDVVLPALQGALYCLASLPAFDLLPGCCQEGV